MNISAQFLPQKISAHFQFHLLNLRVDVIPPKLLKEFVSTQLAKLFNLSLEEGIFRQNGKKQILRRY